MDEAREGSELAELSILHMPLWATYKDYCVGEPLLQRTLLRADEKLDLAVIDEVLSRLEQEVWHQLCHWAHILFRLLRGVRSIVLTLFKQEYLTARTVVNHVRIS